MKFFEEVSFNEVTPKEYINSKFPWFTFSDVEIHLVHNGEEYWIDHGMGNEIEITSQDGKDLSGIEKIVKACWGRNILEEEEWTGNPSTNSIHKKINFVIPFTHNSVKRAIKNFYLRQFSNLELSGELAYITEKQINNLKIPKEKFNDFVPAEIKDMSKYKAVRIYLSDIADFLDYNY